MQAWCSRVVGWISAHVSFGQITRTTVEYGIDFVVVMGTSVAILLLRHRQYIGVEAATLILIGVIFAVASHIFPWYTAAFLPWIAMLAGPLWTRKDGLSGKGLAAAAAWYFVVASVLGYLFRDAPSWNLYYVLAYDVTLVVLGVAAVVGIVHYRTIIGLRNHNVPVA